MAEPVSEFRQAIERVCSGSQEAAYHLIDVYGPHLLRVVRSRLHSCMRPKYDSLDFVQMVWMSLFTDLDKLATFQEPEELIRYLVVLARNKVIEESRRRTMYQRYNIRRERLFETTSYGEPLGVSLRLETPSAQLMAREHVAVVLGTKSSRDRTIFELRMEGETFQAISARLGISERTARQVMSDIEHDIRELGQD